MSTGTFASPGQIGPRFQLVSAVPTATSVLLLGSLILAGAPAQAPTLSALRDNLTDIGIVGATGLLIAVVVLGLAFHPFQYALVQVLEGYWPARGPLRHAALWGIRSQLERRARAEDARLELLTGLAASSTAQTGVNQLQLGLATRRLQDYPEADERVLPTRLGNVLRSREDLAGDRFGLDALAVIPRLYPLIPDSHRAMVEDARSSLDLNVRFTATWLFTGLLSSVLLLDLGWWNLLPLGMYLLGYVAYRGAIASARSYGNLLVRTIDLYRLELLRQVGFPPPTDLHDEKAMFAAFLELASGNRLRGEVAGTRVLQLPAWCHKPWAEATRLPKRVGRAAVRDR